MTAQQREQFVTDFLDVYTFNVMKGKGAEYSRGEEDVNSNLKRTAQAIGLDPLQVAWVFTLKHLDSISNFIKTRQTPSGEPIEGRIGDAVNYLIILASLIKEMK